MAKPRWSGMFPISPSGYVALPHVVVCMVAYAAPLVAYTMPTGTVVVSRFDTDRSSPVWLAPTMVAPDGAAVPGSKLGLVAIGGLGRARLAWASPSGEIRAITFSTRAAGNGWSEPSTLVRAGRIKPGSAMAGVVEDEFVHWFAETVDGSIARIIDRVAGAADASARVERLAGSRERRPDTGFALARRAGSLVLLIVGADGHLRLGSPSPYR